ncbi:tail fiber assembly protein [Escherichia coli]
MRFSVKTQAFYASEIDYGDSLPSDAAEINDEQYRQFYEAVNNDSRIYFSDGAFVISSQRPDDYHSWDENSNEWIMTDEDIERKKRHILQVATDEKQRRISQANDYINSKQWPGKAAIGRLKGDELAQYNLWLDYLDALEAVDTSSAPDINWPTPPEV